MGTDSTLYQIVLLLHIAATIVGFGGLIAHGAYNARAFRGPAGVGSTLIETTRGVSKIAEYAIYAVLPLGIVLIAVSDDTFGFGDPWVSASFLVWFVMVGVYHGLVRPALRAIGERAAAVAPDSLVDTDQDAVAASKRLMMGEAATQLLVVVALFLMIWKPGA